MTEWREEGERATTPWGLVGLAAVCTVALGVLYVLAVRTGWGQRLNAAALHGRGSLRPRAIDAAGRLLTTISVGSLVLLGAAIVVVALVTRRPDRALAAAALIGGSVFTTELLKRAVLPRPYLGVIDALGTRASFPSGHTTVAMSLAVGAIVVAPDRWRSIVTVAAVAYPSAIGIAVVATGNHRPADPMGAALVVTAWASVVAAFLIVPNARAQRDRVGYVTPGLAVLGLILLAAAFIGLVALSYALRRGSLDTVELGAAFLGACAAIVGTILVCVALLTTAMRQAVAGVRPAEPEITPGS